MADAMSASRIFRWGLALAAAVAALGLAWLIVAVAVARSTADYAPDEALRWRPGHAAALARAAELALPEGVFDRDTEAVEALARRALANGPLEVAAIRVLGEAAEARGDEDGARKLISTAAARSLRDGPSHAWMMRDHLRAGRYAPAFEHGKVLLWVPGAGRMVSRQMAAAAASDPKAREALAEVFADAEDRSELLSRELAAIMDPGAYFYFLIDLKDAGGTLRRDETARAIASMLRTRDVAQAYLAWVQLLPQEGQQGLGNVYDGDFEGLPGAPPFNWNLRADAGTEISPTPGGTGQSLYIQYEGERPRPLTEQTLLLPPGPYRLRVRARMAGEGYGEQLVWTASCAGVAEPLFQFDAPDEAEVWRELSAGFTVPEGCAWQHLRLNGRPGDRLGFVRGWFDGMIIEQRGGE